MAPIDGFAGKDWAASSIDRRSNLFKQRCSTLLRSNERSVLRSFKMLFEIHSGLKNRWIIDDEKDKNIYDRVVGADSRFSAGQYFGFPRQSVHPGGSKRTAAGNCPDDSARSPQPPACN